MVIAGCTFAGADWSSGSMTNQLLFEPRRGRVWLAKARRGHARQRAGRPGGDWPASGSIAGTGRRRLATSPSPRAHVDTDRVARRCVPSALAMGAALGGFALTMVFRHTVADPGAAVRLQHRRRDRGQPAPRRGRRSGGRSATTRSAGWPCGYRYFDVERRAARRASGAAPTQTMTHLEAGTFLGVLLAARRRRLAALVPPPRRLSRARGSARLVAVVLEHRRVVVALEVDRVATSPPVSAATSRSR